MVEGHDRVEPGKTEADAGLLVRDHLGIDHLGILVYTLHTK